MKSKITVLKNISELASLKGVHEKQGSHLVADDAAIIKNAAVICKNAVIDWVGHQSDLDEVLKSYSHCETKEKNLQGCCLIPQLVDSHTHLVFGGDRSEEYLQRLNGVDYQEIANKGGGILATMQATLCASEQELYELGKERVESFYNNGIGVIEIKSGYALTKDGEIKLAKVIDRLKSEFYPRVIIHHTFMAAHAVPANYQSSHDYLVEVVIPTMHHLSQNLSLDSVDIFHEQGYFSTADCELLFSEAQKIHLPVRIHADEFYDNQGASLAAKWQCLSADHLLAISEQGIADLAASSTVATLLPGTAFFLGKKLAPAQKLLQSGCKVAIASDFNPGSCHWPDLWNIAVMSAPSLKLNIAQLLAAITYNSANSLGLHNMGALTTGMSARFTVLETPQIAKALYSWGQSLNRKTLNIT